MLDGMCSSVSQSRTIVVAFFSLNRTTGDGERESMSIIIPEKWVVRFQLQRRVRQDYFIAIAIQPSMQQRNELKEHGHVKISVSYIYIYIYLYI